MVHRYGERDLPESGIHGNVQSRVCADFVRRPHLQDGLRGNAGIPQSKQCGCDDRGDTVTGAATVILAMGAGKDAAAAIDEYIKSK